MRVGVLAQNQFLIDSLRNNLGISGVEADEQISQMTPYEVFERVLNWNNLVGYGRGLMKVKRVLWEAASMGKLNYETLSVEGEEILDVLRQRASLPDVDASDYQEADLIQHVESLSALQAFNEYLRWYGLGLDGEQVVSILDTITQAQS